MSYVPPQFDTRLEPYHAWVGRVASSYAAFELTLDAMIWFLADTPPMIGACMTTQIGNLYAKLRAINALLALLEGGDKIAKELNQLSTEAREVSEARARVVHDAWGISQRGEIGQITNAIIGKNPVLEPTVRDIAWLMKTQQRANGLMAKANDLLHKMKDTFPSTSRKWLRPVDGISFGKIEKICDDG